MAVSHVFSNTVSNGTNTNVVRPQDWNSGHNHFFTLGGNTTGQSTVSGTDIQWAGGPGVTLSMAQGAGAATISVLGGATLSSYEPWPLQGLNLYLNPNATATSSAAFPSIWPISMPQYVSAGCLNLMASMNFSTNGTSSGRHTLGYSYAVYSRGTGANSTGLSSILGGSFSYGVTGNNSTYTINQPTTTNYTGYGTGSTTSAGVNITSGYTGRKLIQLPINTLFSPGVYWFAMMVTGQSSSNAPLLNMSFYGVSSSVLFTDLAPVGSFSSAYTNYTGVNGGEWVSGLGLYNAGQTNLPQTFNFQSIGLGANISYFPALRLWST